MLKQLNVAGTAFYVEFKEVSECPICKSKISPIYLSNHYEENDRNFSIFCKCPSCHKTFVTFFKSRSDTTMLNNSRYSFSNIEYSAPNISSVKTFDEKIANLSPNFVETYNQSLSAESYNLSQIAGMGYRKALEFLIKDYCILKNPDDKDTILKMFLGNCINTYIDDSKIKSLTKLSVWLGNDETHYIRKFLDKDINDLKRYIDTALYFILYNLNADEADEIVNNQ